jgi:hypothetical protein
MRAASLAAAAPAARAPARACAAPGRRARRRGPHAASNATASHRGARGIRGGGRRWAGPGAAPWPAAAAPPGVTPVAGLCPAIPRLPAGDREGRDPRGGRYGATGRGPGTGRWRGGRWGRGEGGRRGGDRRVGGRAAAGARAAPALPCGRVRSHGAAAFALGAGCAGGGAARGGGASDARDRPDCGVPGAPTHRGAGRPPGPRCHLPAPACGARRASPATGRTARAYRPPRAHRRRAGGINAPPARPRAARARPLKARAPAQARQLYVSSLQTS